jgi:putative endonuclease
MFGWFFRAVDHWRHWLRLKKMPAHLAWGARAEDLAHRYLEAQGMKVIAQNWRRAGRKEEIDLVATERGQLVVVEVKSRRNAGHADPSRNLDAVKRFLLTRAGLDFARRHKVKPEKLRFDEVLVVFEPFGIEHHRDAWSVRTAREG